MKAKRALDGTPKECEDNFSSAVISLPDGKTIRLDAVFDGMGGHGGGRRASEIAKEVFEVAAVAGWIRTPEDVRAVIITMDVAIVMDQVESKKSLDQPYHTNAMQTNSMGTTATIAYQKGDEFYGIHCGDSDWKIHRGDQVVAEGVGHSGIYTTFFKEVLREYEQKGLTLRTLNAAQATEFYAEVIRRANEVSFPANYIGSALGHGASPIHINNVVFGFEPVRLQKGDIVRVNSDGVGVPICDHEVSYVLGMYHGDLEMTRDALIAMAEERRIDNRKGPIMRDAQGLVIRDEDGNPQHEAITEFDTLCSCKRRKSKIDDDKTIMLRRV
jgi:hypothetical protein